MKNKIEKSKNQLSMFERIENITITYSEIRFAENGSEDKTSQNKQLSGPVADQIRKMMIAAEKKILLAFHDQFKKL